MASLLTPTQRYAVGSLLALALRQSQIHQTRPLGSPIEDGLGLDVSSGGSDPDDPDLWTHESRGLLRPVFSFLDIDPKTWSAIEETAALSITNHHVEALLTIFFEEESNQSPSQENIDQKLALTKSIDALVMTFEQHSGSNEAAMEKQREYEYQCRERNSPEKSTSEKESTISEISNLEKAKLSATKNLLDSLGKDKSMLWNNSENYQCKMAFFYELLSACLVDPPKKDKKSHLRSGYDARHRIALRLLGTWLDIQWIKVEAMEVMVACTAMAAAKEVAEKSDSEQPNDGKWSKWKRGGIIGAAALTGGTLLAITGGLAAPAIAAGFGALAPTLGAIVPVIGASGFAAAASAAGTVAGSVAVAASFGAAGAGLSGRKMARRTGIVKEFEFKPIGENHNQGHLAVGILVSGFVFNDEDFLRPWQHVEENLERYAVQWESKNLIAMSNAIQDWITSSLTMGLMKQGAMLTVLNGLVAALAWPATLLAATNFIDSHWAVAIDRSNQAGKLLAEALMKGLQGNRPVTLFGFSLGARVIFKCLQHLAESGDNEGLVERVVLLGAPIPLTSEPWESSRKMVAGRFVNVYATNDWILGCAFRASLFTQGLAGIQPVNIAGVENVDVTEYLNGHSSYLWAVQHILDQLEMDTYYPVFSCSPGNTSGS